MHRNSALSLYWLCLGIAAALGCSAKDKGVRATFDNEASQGASDEEEEEEEGPGRNGNSGAPVMDAGSPDEHEIVEVEQPDATCAATSAEAPKIVIQKEVVIEVPREEIKPVAIYLMLDRSSSMVGVCSGGVPCNPQSWNEATGALSAFLRDPASADLNVALGYFPPKVTYTDKAPGSPLCTGASCGTATVTMRRAADNAAAITDSLNASVPSTNFASLTYTPTECGLRGIKAFCAAHRAANNNEKCVGVLITDGAPTECNTNTAALREVAAAQAMDIPVFTLGMTGADFTFLNEIALGGGTDCTPNDPATAACDVSSGQAAFVAALNAIRDKVQVKETRIETRTETMEVPLECEWKLPDPPQDMKFDKEKVNVTFSAEGKDSTSLGRVTSKEECDKHPDGWHYDSEDTPSKVLACAGACEKIKTSSGAKISIEFGCKGRTLE